MTAIAGSPPQGIPGRSAAGGCGLLVSVRDAAEAAEAVAGGATIVDVKEPGRGPLGAADAATAASVAAVVGHVPWTMACGELCDGVDAIHGLVRATIGMLVPGARPPSAAKAGLAGAVGEDWPALLATFAGGLPPGMEPVAVAYADWNRAAAPAPPAVIAAAARAGCRWLLIDTCDKAAGSVIRDAASVDQAAVWADRARRAGMRVVLAGSLTAETLPAARAIGPDVVAVRAAACVGGRLGGVSRKLVRRLGRLCGPSGEGPADRAPETDREIAGGAGSPCPGT